MKLRLALPIVVCAVSVGLIARNRRPPAPPERFVEVDAGGHRLHMVIVGDSGPTVVMESGLPGGLGYQHVRSEVGRFARAVAYDRAGVGKSEPGPQPRNAKQIATELHAALHNGNLLPPYVLVGQSMGGPYIRVFASMYRDEVRGMVIVDPARADTIESMEDVKAWFAANRPDQWARAEAVSRKVPLGGDIMMAAACKRMEVILTDYSESRREGMRREWWAMVDSFPERLAPELSPGARDEFKSASETFRQAVAASPLPKVPIILIAAGQQDEYSEVTACLNPNMRVLHESLKRAKIADYQKWVDATPGAKLIVARNSGHNVQTEAPGLVIGAIREVIAQSERRMQSQ